MYQVIMREGDDDAPPPQWAVVTIMVQCDGGHGNGAGVATMMAQWAVATIMPQWGHGNATVMPRGVMMMAQCGGTIMV